MRMKYFILSILFLFCTGLNAETYLGGMFLGDPIIASDSRSLGMGGTGIAYNVSPSTIVNNPANISLSKGIKAQMTGSALVSSEEMYSINKVSYSSTGYDIGFTDVNLNSQTYYNLNSAGFIFPLTSSAGVGICYYKFQDFDYINTLYKYKSSIERTGIYDIKQRGSINSLSLAGAFVIEKIIAIGIGFDLLTGKKTLSNKVYDYPDGIALVQNDNENLKMSGNRINFGFNIELTKKLNFGGFYQTSPVIGFSGDNANGNKIDYDITYPQRYGIGMAYEVLVGYNTIFAFDFIFTPWRREGRYKNNLDIFSKEVNLRYISGYKYINNVYEMHLGAEHNIVLKADLLKMPVRYGVMWVPHYLNNRVELVMVTFGLGFEGPYLLDLDTKIDISVGIGKRNYIGIYKKEPYDPPVDDDKKPRIIESMQSVLLSLSFVF